MIKENLATVRARIAAAASRSGRDPASITLIGVSKTKPVERVREGIEAGLTHLGENRVQEAAPKIESLASLDPQPTWHLIGHLQSNKARRAATVFSWVQSVDREELARRLDRAAGELQKTLAILIQVDLGGEATKHGAARREVENLVQVAESLPHLRVRGLMTIPPLGSHEETRPFFRELRQMRDDLESKGHDLPELSMGMTNDFEVAVEEGATMVRVGTALFGARSTPR